ncbi:MAG: GntR family transcriptional regulator [Clostridia bacterium]|nr:GntR family transcriptional regulator [Clostridia bacterium]
MHVIITYETGEPIYEQIKSQIRGEILRGSLKAGETLPSIRTLAKELKIGIITAKRAYDDLCAEGFLYSVQGKGVFVAEIGSGTAEGYATGVLKEKFEDVKEFAEMNSISKETIEKIYKEILG